ncbi:hypothetical protein ACFXK0_00045 [Nocardia sp. NPDC059177]|uniref:hypothetical protein n=1 Tax=Nocardia sp. NPDC059177 TaxID=3346759 RepID=UPI0036BF479A
MSNRRSTLGRGRNGHPNSPISAADTTPAPATTATSRHTTAPTISPPRPPRTDTHQRVLFPAVLTAAARIHTPCTERAIAARTCVEQTTEPRPCETSAGAVIGRRTRAALELVEIPQRVRMG